MNKEHMMETQLRKRGISDEKVLTAMEKVERKKFVPEFYSDFAYADSPIPIGHGQTISQPYVVAMMVEALELEKEDTVLEVGTGSGYNAAVMAMIAKEIYSIEIVDKLFEQTSRLLTNYSNVHVLHGNGYEGLPDKAPFDKIILTAAPPHFPAKLWDQLKEGGVMVAPIGPRYSLQQLFRFRKLQGQMKREFILDVKFVPMVEEQEGPPHTSAP